MFYLVFMIFWLSSMVLSINFVSALINKKIEYDNLKNYHVILLAIGMFIPILNFIISLIYIKLLLKQKSFTSFNDIYLYIKNFLIEDFK